MILKTLFIDLWNYSKFLFTIVVLIIVTHLYFNFRFACLARLVDNHKQVMHPYAFEAFPFVVYNMYSGKIDDWNKYSYLKIEADGEEFKVTDLAISQEDQFVNPTQKFLFYKNQNFSDSALLEYLQYTLGHGGYISKVYTRVSNQQLFENEKLWQRWFLRYLEKTMERKVESVKISECFFSYNSSGKPVIEDQKLLYQF